jgi:predicted  nucleic acid-binding Zn-ribbon protein
MMVNESLRQQLALLYQLQEHDLQLLSLHQKLQTIPRQIAQLNADVVQSEKDVAAKSAELAETEKVQRAKSAELEMNAVQREKYQTEQRIVTSNEAYTALERQIEFLDKEDEEAEDTILVLMEENDRLKAELAELEVEVNREKEKTATETKQLQQDIRTLETESNERLNERKAFLPKINKAFRDEYHRWMKSRLTSKSSAARAKTGFVALGKNGICSSCRIAIQPQTLKEAQKYQKAVYCSSCKRLLYVEPANPDIPFP